MTFSLIAKQFKKKKPNNFSYTQIIKKEKKSWGWGKNILFSLIWEGDHKIKLILWLLQRYYWTLLSLIPSANFTLWMSHLFTTGRQSQSEYVPRETPSNCQRKRLLGISIASSCSLAHALLINKNRTLTSIRMTKLLRTFPRLLLGSTTRSNTLFTKKPFHTILINNASADFSFVLPKYKFNISMTGVSNQNQRMDLIFNPGPKNNFTTRKYIFEDSYRPLREA